MLHYSQLAADHGTECALPPAPDPWGSVERNLRMLWRRRWLFLLVFVPVFAIGACLLIVMPERFTAHATLIVGFRQPELATVDPGRDSLLDPDIDGAIELMKSQAALRYVAATLAAAGHAQFGAAPAPASPSLVTRLRQDLVTPLRHALVGLLGRRVEQPGPERQPPDPAEMAAGRLRKDFRFERVGHSALVDVAFTATDPVVAALAANAMAAFSDSDESFLSHMSMAERSGFQIVKTSIMSSASVPDEPSSPNMPLIGGASLLVALGAAFSAALLREYRAQQTVLSTEEVSRRGLRTLGLIPSYRAVAEPGPAFDNSVDSLQAALSTLPDLRPQCGMVLLFTSPLPEEGKSTTVAALAVSLAGSGKKVLLVDADLRSPTLHLTFGLALRPGVSACLRAGLHEQDLIQRDPASGVHVLTAGEPIRKPLEILTSARLHELIEAWRAAYDVVLIDSPPVLAVGDARLLASAADYTVVVARWGKTSWTTLTQALRIISESGGRIAGVTVSRVDVRELSRYDYADAMAYGAASRDYANVSKLPRARARARR